MRLLFAIPLLAACAAQAAERPNIVLLLADDLGYGDLGCYGRKDVRTPAIDGLAAAGVRFTDFYANGPECTPTRTGLLTGRYQHRVGGLETAIGTGNVGRYDDAIRLRETHDLGLPVAETSLARLLRDAGYATAIYGKWHLGYEPKFAPGGHGFDDALYGLGGGMDYFHATEPNGDPVLRRNGKPAAATGYFTDIVADEAVRFIGQQRDRPFFLYVPFTAPHTPYQGPDDRQPKPLDEDSPLWDQGRGPRATYVAMIERMDRSVGRILKTLDDKQLTSNTVVIFASDNGASQTGSNAPFSGFKGGTYEGGIRVPAVVRWPGTIRPGTVSRQVAITMDLTASIARIAGAKPAAGRSFDGIDILQLVSEGRPPQPRTLCWRIRRGGRTWWAIRDGSLKLVRQADGAKQEESLFDLAADPGEKTDLLAARPADAERLRAKLAAWEKEVRPVR